MYIKMGTVRWEQSYEDGKIVIKEIHKVIVYKFSVGDMEDPEVYAAQPMWDWQQSEPGKFIMEHAIDKPTWNRYVDFGKYGHQYAIVAELEMKKLSEYYLRWGNEYGI